MNFNIIESTNNNPINYSTNNININETDCQIQIAKRGKLILLFFFCNLEPYSNRTKATQFISAPNKVKMVITWVTSSAMLRPSTAVCAFTDTTLHTREKEDELFAFWYLMLLLLEVGPTTQNCLGVVSSDLGLKIEDVNGLIREAEPIFLCSLSPSRCLLNCVWFSLIWFWLTVLFVVCDLTLGCVDSVYGSNATVSLLALCF